jgi:sugar diacid utilization regulator
LDVQRSRHSQLLQALLRDGEGAVSSATALGIDERAWFRLAILVPGPSGLTSMSRPQVRSVSNWLNIVHGKALFAEISSQLVVLFSGQRPEEWRYVERSLDTFLRNSDAVRGRVVVATSLAVTQPRQLSREFDRLHTLARLVARAGSDEASPDRSPIFRMEDHWPQVELTTMAEAYALNDSGRLSALHEIREHDRAHKSEYWKTLRVFVLCDRNFNEAANQLNLHANTVRYRIERLKSTFDLDLTNAATFFWVAVQVHHPSA